LNDLFLSSEDDDDQRPARRSGSRNGSNRNGLKSNGSKINGSGPGSSRGGPVRARDEPAPRGMVRVEEKPLGKTVATVADSILDFFS
jgi:hypothetical protein